MSVYSNTCSA